MVSKYKFLFLGLIVSVGLGGGLWYVLKPAQKATVNANVSALNLQSGEGFKQATEVRAFTFPDDHGPHRDYQTEWWYYTGNLKTEEGREFGYQLTFFRQGLSSEPISRTAELAANEVYLAHFTVTDVEAGEFYSFERVSRGSQTGLAGAKSNPYHIFVEDWSAEGTGSTVTLTARNDTIAIKLDLESEKQPTLQGNGGLSAKGTNVGQASYYYSLTRMKTTGAITIKDQTFNITGSSWFDHEWSTNSLGQGQVGWEWFGLHLDDGRDVMWGQLRRADGSIDFAAGSITGPNIQGRTGMNELTILQSDDAILSKLNTWASPATNVEYPTSWRLQIPQADLDLEITALIPNQELRLNSITYWEGAVGITGSVTGRGYAELTGYGAGGQQLR
jgi:predicted secreted hydrolase